MAVEGKDGMRVVCRSERTYAAGCIRVEMMTAEW